MPLTLTAISYRGRPPTDHTAAVLTNRAGTIGRAPDNDLVLADPEKVISRFHASIRYEKASFYITDTSLAGTAIINRGITLHKNTPQETARLENGDRLRIGDYELTVSVSEEQEFPSPLPRVNVVHEPPSSVSRFGPDTTEDNLELESLLNGGKSSRPDIYRESGGNQSAHPHAADFLRGPAHQESFTPPETVSSPPPVSQQEVIPGDFNLQDLLNSLDEPEDHHQPTDFPDIPPPPVENIPEVSASDIHLEPPSIAPSPPEPVPLPPEAGPVIAESIPTPAPPSPERPADEEIRVPLSPPPPPPPPVAPPVVAPVAGAGGRQPQEELLALFFEAAGIGTQPSMRPEEIAEFMQVTGTLVREITGGLMTMLRGRMEIKNQFRVSKTILRPTGNNPLKFSLTPEDALRLLLVEKKPGFLKAVEAVQQACTDIMNHEMASTAANQASLLAILKQFDPQNFSQQYEEGFVFQKKSKCWETYCQAYPELIKNAQENFFGEEFADAYEEQMQKLKSMNRANQQTPRDKHHE